MPTRASTGATTTQLSRAPASARLMGSALRPARHTLLARQSLPAVFCDLELGFAVLRTVVTALTRGGGGV